MAGRQSHFRTRSGEEHQARASAIAEAVLRRGDDLHRAHGGAVERESLTSLKPRRADDLHLHQGFRPGADPVHSLGPETHVAPELADSEFRHATLPGCDGAPYASCRAAANLASEPVPQPALVA
jgi:hypothetical protein